MPAAVAAISMRVAVGLERADDREPRAAGGVREIERRRRHERPFRPGCGSPGRAAERACRSSAAAPRRRRCFPLQRTRVALVRPSSGRTRPGRRGCRGRRRRAGRSPPLRRGTRRRLRSSAESDRSRASTEVFPSQSSSRSWITRSSGSPNADALAGLREIEAAIDDGLPLDEQHARRAALRPARWRC